VNLVPSNEIFRKIIHLSASIIPLGYLWVIQDKYTMLIILNCLCLVSIFVEVGRRKWNWIETIFERFFNIGDTFAALVGKSFPIGKIKQKTLSGTMAGFITSTAAALYVNQLVPTEIILLGSGVAMVVELAPNLINDNVTIPLSGGLAMTYGMMIL
jgi:dolichol kinase